MINQFSIILDTELLKLMYKHNFFNKQENEKFILQNEFNCIKLFFISNDIDLEFTIPNSTITKKIIEKSDINTLLENNNIYDHEKIIKAFKNGIHIELETMMTILKIASLSTKIIIIAYDDKTIIWYKKNNTLFSVEINTIFNTCSYTLDYSIQSQQIISTQFIDLVNILKAHKCIQTYKSVTGLSPQTQISIQNKLQILSTNYTIGLINYLEINNQINNIQELLQLGKTIDINKIYNLFTDANLIEIITYEKKTYDIFKRHRDKFIRIVQHTNKCYIRLYTSNISSFDETIIDDQINNTALNIPYLSLIDISKQIQNIHDLKKINNIEIQLHISTDETNIINTYINCIGDNKKINFMQKIHGYLNHKITNAKINIPGHTLHMICNIIANYNYPNELTCYINLSNTGEQGKITSKDKYQTNIIFV